MKEIFLSHLFYCLFYTIGSVLRSPGPLNLFTYDSKGLMHYSYVFWSVPFWLLLSCTHALFSNFWLTHWLLSSVVPTWLNSIALQQTFWIWLTFAIINQLQLGQLGCQNTHTICVLIKLGWQIVSCKLAFIKLYSQLLLTRTFNGNCKRFVTMNYPVVWD